MGSELIVYDKTISLVGESAGNCVQNPETFYKTVTINDANSSFSTDVANANTVSLDDTTTTRGSSSLPASPPVFRFSSFRHGSPFVRRRKCDSCAIVLPAGTLSNSNLGQKIDAHHCVIRTNDAPTRYLVVADMLDLWWKWSNIYFSVKEKEKHSLILHEMPRSRTCM